MTLTIILALIVACFVGYELGKYMTMDKIKSTIREVTKQLEETTKKMKEAQGETNHESIEKH